MRALVLAAALLLAACETTSVSGTATTAPIFGYPAAAWDVRPEGRQWTTIANLAIDELAPQLLGATPSDIDAFCPGYRTASPANRRAFYVALISEIARQESAFDPAATFTETMVDAQGRRIVSRGLLQLSQESANGYGCAIAQPSQLQDPAANIQCGVRILARWVAQDGLLAGYQSGAWRGASRYWSVFRDRNKLADIQGALNARPYCARR